MFKWNSPYFGNDFKKKGGRFTLFWARAEGSFLVGVVYGELWNMFRGDSWLAMEELLFGGVEILEGITVILFGNMIVH